MLRAAIVLVLFAHGIGHSMGLLQLFKLAVVNPEWKGDSWLMSGVATPVTSVVALLLWTAAIIGFTALAAILVGWLPGAWWQPLAVASALVSLAGLLLFPTAFPLGSSIGAFVVDAALLIAVIAMHWGPSQLASA
jgi:hypothetical protein